MSFSIAGCADDDDDQTDDDDDNDDYTLPPPPGEEAEVFVDGDDLVLRNKHISLRYHLDNGTYNIHDADGMVVVLNADSRVTSHVLIPLQTWPSSEGGDINWYSTDAANVLGEGMSVTVQRDPLPGAPMIEQTFTVLDGKSCMLTSVKAHNFTGSEMEYGAIYPLYTDPAVGAFFWGNQADLRILTNGAFDLIEFAVPLRTGLDGTISNWSILFYNQTTLRSMHLGFLTFVTGHPVFYHAPAPKSTDALVLHADSQIFPAKKIKPGGWYESEMMILDIQHETPFAAVERYGDRLKAWLDITLWLEKSPDNKVPVGWNSWSGGGSSGGYGTDINEALMIENMDFADRELRRWGMNYFQFDDGWQTARGDWDVRTDRFPDHGDMNGIQWLMHRANEMGFETGVWMQGFHADKHSNVYKDHPDWIAGPVVPFLEEDEPLMDLTHPEVQDHLRYLGERMYDWGARWFKLDFAYRIYLTGDWYDPDYTRLEVYKKGVEIFREALGDEVLFLNVAINGPNYGLIDSCRLTLDTMPVWEGESDDPYGPIETLGNQGLKPMYRDSARRYWLNQRVWLNHPDLIFYRAHRNQDLPPLTLNESNTFLTAVSMQGGLVKLGDRLLDLFPEAVDSIRRIIPANEITGRPLDMFEREFPEVWSLSLEDFVEPYHVIGLLNWGLNRDLTTIPFSWVSDNGRVLEVDLAEAGLDLKTTYLAFEFWQQKYLGEVTDTLSVTVPARSPRVVALRPKLDRPMFLGANRHVMGGRGVVRDLTWSGDEKVLTGVQEGAIGTEHSPFTNQVTIYAPADYQAAEVRVTAPEYYEISDLAWNQEGSLVTFSFKVEELPEACPSGLACMHPDVTWVVEF